jgi:orotate phosphoribosyltransferase
VAERALDDAGIDRLVDVLAASDVLTFGDLTTKSGRPTPYFVDFGRVRSGPQLAALAECYADGIQRTFGTDVDVLFGPAYKGIPLAVATSLALAARGIDVGFAFDRKEAKDHGEGGTLVGMRPSDGDRILVLEDVTTAGTSLRHTIPLLRATADVDVVGVLVGVDRLEHATVPTETALTSVARELGVRAAALATIVDVASRLHGHGLDDEGLARIRAHLDRYGAVEA